MVRFLLNSGGLENSDDKGRSFFRDLVKGLNLNPKIVICLFAQPREDWEHSFRANSEWICRHLDDQVLELRMCLPESFVSDCEWADVIYINGGDDHLCQYWLKKFDIKSLFDGKTVGTNSAGSNAMCTSSWTCDWRQIIDGIGVVPVKFIAHYESMWGIDDPRGPISWQKAYKELAAYGDKSLPVHALEEGEYVEYIV